MRTYEEDKNIVCGLAQAIFGQHQHPAAILPSAQDRQTLFRPLPIPDYLSMRNWVAFLNEAGLTAIHPAYAQKLRNKAIMLMIGGRSNLTLKEIYEAVEKS